MILIKDIKLFLKDKYALLSLLFIGVFQLFLIFYSQSDILMRVYLSSVDGIYLFFIKIVLIIFTLIFLSNFLQVVYQFSAEKENFMMARSLQSGVKNFIRSKVFLANITAVLITQPFYWTIVLLNGFDENMEMRFIYFSSFVLLFAILTITSFSSYYILSKAHNWNNYILGVKNLLVLTFITFTGLLFYAMTILLPIILIYQNYNNYNYYDHSNIIFISILSIHFVILFTGRYYFNKVCTKIENSEE